MSKINFEVIDQFFAAQIAANESEATLESLRPQVEVAVKDKGWTGTLEYHGFKIIVSRPKSFTWELNNQLQDANLDYYKKQHAMYEQLNSDLKELRADMKRTGEKLAKDHPDSESIKVGFRLAIKQ